MSVGVLAIDGTKIKACASMDNNRTYQPLVTEILREAEETDRREDDLYGEAHADPLPARLRTAEARKRVLGGASGAAASRGAPRAFAPPWLNFRVSHLTPFSANSATFVQRGHEQK